MSASSTESTSEATGGLYTGEPSVWQRLENSWKKYPRNTAIISLHQPVDLYNIAKDRQKKYLAWTYSDLKVAVDRFSSSISQLGAGSGTVLATCLDNGIEFVIAYWSAHRLGCTLVPINPRTLINQDEMIHMLDMTRTTIIIAHDTEQGGLLGAIEEKRGPFSIKILVSHVLPDDSWIAFSTLVDHDVTGLPNTLEEMPKVPESIVTVLFTSGTTSKPKGVPHTNTTLNAFCQNLSLSRASSTHIFCSVLPNNHAMGYFFPLHFMMQGGAIVYPSAVFDSVAMTHALEIENVTHTAIVPTGLYALLEAIEIRKKPLVSSLQDVCIAGGPITKENIYDIFTKLKSKGASTGFGMTEGSPIWIGSQQNPEDLIIGGSVLAGSVSSGATVRICAPKSRVPLPLGQAGEIHQTGPGTIKSYLDPNSGTEQFYTDEEGRTWFITGDQATMHPGRIFSITGRYKDMIIRGGENISPAAIEAAINRHCNIQCSVVGAPDFVAGEVPILILGAKELERAEEIRNAVLKNLGPAFVPERMFTPSELGFDEIPQTSSLKVQTSQMAARVRTLLSNEQENSTNNYKVTVKEHVLVAYRKATGIPVDKLTMDATVSQFADSIALMRVRHYLRKSLGQTLSIQEMVDKPTIASQIETLHSQGPNSDEIRVDALPDVLLLNVEHLNILFGGPEEARTMQLRISDILRAKKLSWTHVLSIIPVHDYMQVLLDSGIVDTWNFAIAVSTKASSIAALQTALQTALSSHPVLTSFIVFDDEKRAQYVTIQPSEDLWRACIFKYGSVDTVQDLEQLAIRFPEPKLSRIPGPLISCLLFEVKDNMSVGVLFYVHHAVQDASSFRLFLEDLNQAISAPSKKLAVHTDFNGWADFYSALRLSPAATASVGFHVERLRGLHHHKVAFYPAAKFPRQANTEDPDGLDYSFDAPGLVELRREYPSISAAVVLKAALALVNVSRTGYSHACFCNFEAGRSRFPFVPPTVQASNPSAFEASDVNGPIIQGVCNLIEVTQAESALDLLKRVQSDQENLTKHAHAPLQRIIAQLNSVQPGCGDSIIEAQRTQFMTWVPGLLGDYEKLRVEKIAIRCAAGLAIVAGIGGENGTSYGLSMRWDAANFSRDQTKMFVQDLGEAVKWVTERGNWGRPVCSIIDDLKNDQIL